MTSGAVAGMAILERAFPLRRGPGPDREPCLPQRRRIVAAHRSPPRARPRRRHRLGHHDRDLHHRHVPSSAAVLVPDFHNPTGAYMPDTQRALVGRALARQDTLTFIDGRSPRSGSTTARRPCPSPPTTPVPSPSARRASPIGVACAWAGSAPARTCSPDSSTPASPLTSAPLSSSNWSCSTCSASHPACRTTAARTSSAPVVPPSPPCAPTCPRSTSPCQRGSQPVAAPARSHLIGPGRRRCRARGPAPRGRQPLRSDGHPRSPAPSPPMCSRRAARRGGPAPGPCGHDRRAHGIPTGEAHHSSAGGLMRSAH